MRYLNRSKTENFIERDATERLKQTQESFFFRFIFEIIYLMVFDFFQNIH